MKTSDINELFTREVYCVLGLPFDNLSLNETKNRIYYHIKEKKRFFLSTPNLNWLTTSSKNATFRESVINSDCSIADGMPIIWISKLLNIPVKHRSAGSDLITAIEKNTAHPKVRIFFFGGAANTGEIACDKINTRDCGLNAVGNFNPGFGSAQEMANEEIFSTINKHSPDFVIVSLGAQKGQKWIELSLNNLNASVISHLGAVVNFYAESVQRSPQWASSWGFEWLWRIYQEPSLYKRYAQDALYLIKQTTQRLIPYWFFLQRNTPRFGQMRGDITNTQDNLSHTISFSGNFGIDNITPVKEAFSIAARANTDIEIDLNDTEYIDSAFLGNLLLLQKYCNNQKLHLRVKNTPWKIRKIFYYLNSEYLLSK